MEKNGRKRPISQDQRLSCFLQFYTPNMLTFALPKKEVAA
jgi:hypothetical protein